MDLPTLIGERKACWRGMYLTAWRGGTVFKNNRLKKKMSLIGIILDFKNHFYRSWSGNSNAILAIKRAMESDSRLNITLPNIVDETILELL